MTSVPCLPCAGRCAACLMCTVSFSSSDEETEAGRGENPGSGWEELGLTSAARLQAHTLSHAAVAQWVSGF